MSTRFNAFSMHFEVPYLDVPTSWRVGDAVLHPAGWLRDRQPVSIAPWPEAFLGPLRLAKWPTIEVPLLRPGDADALWVARNAARDCLAVLDLYRRSRVPFAPIDQQTFGLAIDVHGGEEHRWTTDPEGVLSQASAGRFGAIGTWTFTADDVGAFRDDQRFAFLDDALRAERPTDWQARSISSIRTWAMSRSVARAALRIVLLATALEALLGDEYRDGAGGTGAHQLARRAAFIWCGDGASVGVHGVDRPACVYLTSLTGKSLTSALRERERRSEGSFCSAYWDVRDLWRMRGLALHGGRLDAPSDAARRFDWIVRGVLLSAVAWITRTSAARWDEYEAAIRAVPPAQV